jgi:hypothetical protein
MLHVSAFFQTPRPLMPDMTTLFCRYVRVSSHESSGQKYSTSTLRAPAGHAH